VEQPHQRAPTTMCRIPLCNNWPTRSDMLLPQQLHTPSASVPLYRALATGGPPHCSASVIAGLHTASGNLPNSGQSTPPPSCRCSCPPHCLPSTAVLLPQAACMVERPGHAAKTLASPARYAPGPSAYRSVYYLTIQNNTNNEMLFMCPSPCFRATG
jgi:hypothetical protein